MPRITGVTNLGVSLPTNPIPDRISDRVSTLETDLDAVEDAVGIIEAVGADGTVLTSTGTTYGWEAIPT